MLDALLPREPDIPEGIEGLGVASDLTKTQPSPTTLFVHTKVRVQPV